MEEFIVKEASLFLDSLFMGLLVMAAYDLLRLLRRIMPHKNIFVSMEDFIFWNLAGLFIFGLIYSENDGTIRWFIIVGIIVGAWIYIRSFGTFLVKFVAKYINIILKYILKKPLNEVRMMLRSIFRKVKLLYGKKLRKKEKES